MKFYCKACDETVYCYGILDIQKEIDRHKKREKHLNKIKSSNLIC